MRQLAHLTHVRGANSRCPLPSSHLSWVRVTQTFAQDVNADDNHMAAETSMAEQWQTTTFQLWPCLAAAAPASTVPFRASAKLPSPGGHSYVTLKTFPSVSCKAMCHMHG